VNPRFQVIFSSPAERAIERLPQAMQRRVLAKVRSLAQNPWPVGFLKLTGVDAYRVRVGDYRVIYSVDGGKLIVLVLDVGHRREVYRRR
jgi:mRNA interferase RelE/StbE